MTLDTSTIPDATLDDLARVEGKAELVGGRIVTMSPSDWEHNIVAGEIYDRLKAHSREARRGFVFMDGMGFAVPKLRSGRQTFSPDLAYFDGPRPSNRRKFASGPPTFAVEVRSEGDYGKAAERSMASKRADYFEAGTLVVWDVDPDHQLIHVYRSEAPDRAETFGPGREADAEPAVPGWRVAVDSIFS